MQLAVLKLGGSILTEEVAGSPGVRLQRLRDLAAELSSNGRIVLVHGSGAFGKPPSRRHGYVGGRLAADAAAVVSDVSADLERLHTAVLGAVRDAGRAAFPVPAAHHFFWQAGALRLRSAQPLAELLARGLTPVLASGFVPDLDGGGFAVASSDDMACQTACALGAGLLAFATDAHGVYSRYPATDHWHAELAEDDHGALARVAPSRGDVTGGMAEKLRFGFAAARHGIPTWVIDGRQPGNVAAALCGAAVVGTRLVSSSRGAAAPTESSMTASLPAFTVQSDPALERHIDTLRLQVDGEMLRLFDTLVNAGPMAADPLVRQVYRWSHHYLRSGGRRMHGVTVRLAYEAFGGRDERAALQVATALQLYHHHTMVHDDVYDEDTSRRRWPTTHLAFAEWFAARKDDGAPTRLFGSDAARRGAVSAIAYGKIMHALAFYGLGTAGFPARETLEISNLLNWHDLFDCAGQMKDVDFESRQLPSSAACLNNAWLKTGRLFEVCARIGALLAGASPAQQDAVALWAGNAGVAYQIQDDLEDIVPQSEKGVGRGVGVDLLYCKPTYLYALTRELAQDADRELLATWEASQRTEAGVPAIIAVIERSGARRQVEERVQTLLQQGSAALAACGLAADVVARMERFARYFVSHDYWQRPLDDGTPHVAALFERDRAPVGAPSYPETHLDSARHGLPAAC